MSSALPDVVDAALALSETERASLAYKLMQSLKPEAVLDADAPDLSDELERRVRAYESGDTTADDWDSASERLKQVLRDRQQ